MTALLSNCCCIAQARFRDLIRLKITYCKKKDFNELMMVYDPSVNSTLAPLEVTSMFVVPCGHSSGDICSLIDMQRKLNFSKQTRVCWET